MNNSKLYTDFNYPAKLILFGEYTVLFGGNALAVPYENHSCHWQSGHEFEHQDLGKHIAKVVEDYPFLQFDNSQWTELVMDNHLASSIPRGYGLGSSGAVVAAIFDKFFSIDDFGEDLFLLKNFLGGLESYFHGKSSGIDPLVSLLKVPILIQGTKTKKAVLDPDFKNQFRLYDSKITRNNKSAIPYIQSQYLEKEAYKLKMDILVQLNNEVIADYIAGEFEKGKAKIIEISKLQLELFDNLIPPHVHIDWTNGLQDKNDIFKLCGGGGGGYFFVF